MRSVMTRLIAATAVVFAFATLPAIARAQTPPVPDITDQEFLAAAAQSNRFEIVTGNLAVQRASSRTVRRLGRQFVRHHTLQLELGAAVAEALGISPPPGLNPQQQRDVQRLRDSRGQRFDRLWLAIQLRAHEQAIALHLRGAINGDTPNVRTLAITGLPVIGQHYGELLIVGRKGHRD